MKMSMFAVTFSENETPQICKCKSQYLLSGPLRNTQDIYENLNVCGDVQ